MAISSEKVIRNKAFAVPALIVAGEPNRVTLVIVGAVWSNVAVSLVPDTAVEVGAFPAPSTISPPKVPPPLSTRATPSEPS